MNKNQTNERFEFKIISGTLKGKAITAPNLGVTRPPLSRLRKSIFDFLQPYLFDAAYLDLFSGTGSYLFEAVSRGAIKVYGVELEKILVDSIQNQARKYEVENRLRCYQRDVFEAIPSFLNNNEIFDIIMIAPPQYKGIIDKTLRLLAENRIYNNDTVIIAQHDTSETNKIDFTPFTVSQQRKYGNTTYTVMRSA